MSTWFSDCVPVELRSDRLVIHTPTDFKKDIILTRFADSIKAALLDIFACSMELEVLNEDEYVKFMEHVDNGDPFDKLSADFTFESFVVGSSNKFAHAAAIAVSEKPGDVYNPLLIYGNSGLGKTHLMLAIGQHIHTVFPEKKIIYMKGDDFTNEMVRSLREGNMDAFREKYRSADLLLMDDIQFIAGRQATQEEFFHTFNALHQVGHQIVVTSDRPPMEINTLEDRIRSRLEAGLMVDVAPPDVETRMAITRKKAAQLGMELSDEVVEVIAENVTSNIRQLEGVVKRLSAYLAIQSSISLEDAKRAIKDISHGGDYSPTPDIIIAETARYYGVPEDVVRGQNRSKDVAMARHVSIYLCRSLTSLSLVEIGRSFENRNHATVISSIRKIEDLMKNNTALSATIRDITSNINSKK